MKKIWILLFIMLVFNSSLTAEYNNYLGTYYVKNIKFYDEIINDSYTSCFSENGCSMESLYSKYEKKSKDMYYAITLKSKRNFLINYDIKSGIYLDTNSKKIWLKLNNIYGLNGSKGIDKYTLQITLNQNQLQTLQNSNYINIVFPQEVTGQYKSFAKISLYSLVSYLNNIDKQTMLQNYRQKIQKAMKYRKKHRSYLDAITDKAYKAIKEFNEK